MSIDRGLPNVSLHVLASDISLLEDILDPEIGRSRFIIDSATISDSLFDSFSKNMGNIIWVGEESINNLETFEGKLFENGEENIFSFQLTKYPLAINLPLQEVS